MKRIIYAFIILATAVFWGGGKACAQGMELLIGSTNTSSTYVPVYGLKAADASFHSQIVYPADSLAAIVDKLITGFGFYTKNVAEAPFDSQFEIRIGTMENNAFGSSVLLDNVNYTTVYRGTLDATGEIMDVVFDAPYDYRGGNMVVDITVAEAGTVSGACSFKGSPRQGSSIMRCTGIAGRYPFMPRVRISYSDLPATSRAAEHSQSAELCQGSTGSYYDWNLSLQRPGGGNYDTTIYYVDMRNVSFVGSDTTIVFSHAMPRHLLGCADTERLEMTIFKPVMHYIYDTVCQNTGSYTEHGLNIDLNTHYVGTRTYLTDESDWGRVYDVQCYDTTYLQLTINRSFSLSRSLNICSSRLSEDENGIYYMYGEHRIDIPNYPDNGSYTMSKTLEGSTAKGCDSTMLLNITVSPSDRTDTTVYVRESELPYTTMGVTFTYGSTRSRLLYNQYNCDSIVAITLALKPTYRDTSYITGCGSYEWVVEGNTIATISHDTLASILTTSSDGLDSVVYLRYTRGSINRADTTVVACDLYTFHGVDYTASNNVYDTVPGIGMDCDTQYTWHIRINHPIYRAETADVCDSLMWNGTLYRESTTDIYEYNDNACDNVDTLHLTVRHSTIGDTVVYAPQSFIYFDTTFTESGDHVYTIPNQAECDSVVTIHLSVTPRGIPLPQLYAYEQSVLILNHYPFGDNTRVEYDSIYWEKDGVVMAGFNGDSYHLDNYGPLKGCFKVWVKIGNDWFPTNELCMGSSGIELADGSVDFRMWPNPVRQGTAFNIAVSARQGVSTGWWNVEVYDVEGRRVAQKDVNGEMATMDCRLERGAYIVTVSDKVTGQKSAGKRIVVQ